MSWGQKILSQNLVSLPPKNFRFAVEGEREPLITLVCSY